MPSAMLSYSRTSAMNWGLDLAGIGSTTERMACKESVIVQKLKKN